MQETVDPAQVLGGRYRLELELGRGGMAVVYRALDTVLGREVAIKLMRELADDPLSRERFHAEAELMARLNHPRLITVYDAGVHEDRPFLVMELVNGETLGERSRHGPMPPATVVGIGATLAEALGYIHARGITHRDVKPGNVLLDRSGRAMLADFGIARSLGTPQRTAPGLTMGTAAYLAPEQLRGRPAGPAADVYALGLVLIEALTGHAVYTGAPDVAALARLHTPPRPGPGLPEPLHELLNRMTAEDPGLRPSADEVHARLAALTTGPLDAPAPDVPVAGPAAVDITPGVPTLPLPDATTRADRRFTPGRRWGRGLAAAVALVVAAALAPTVLGARPGGRGAGPAAPTPTSAATSASPRATVGPGPTARKPSSTNRAQLVTSKVSSGASGSAASGDAATGHATGHGKAKGKSKVKHKGRKPAHD